MIFYDMIIMGAPSIALQYSYGPGGQRTDLWQMLNAM